MIRMWGNTGFHPILRWECSSMRQFLLNAPKAAICIPAGFCLAVLLVLPLARCQFPQAMHHLGLRGPGQLSFGGSHVRWC